MFVAHKSKNKDYTHAPWRLQSEGIRIIELWASKRIVNCTSRDTLHRYIIEIFPKLNRLNSPLQHAFRKRGDSAPA
jgi:multisite-specific tRNA:(cytosine-C5)-methyltransferase